MTLRSWLVAGCFLLVPVASAFLGLGFRPDLSSAILIAAALTIVGWLAVYLAIRTINMADQK